MGRCESARAILVGDGKPAMPNECPLRFISTIVQKIAAASSNQDWPPKKILKRRMEITPGAGWAFLSLYEVIDLMDEQLHLADKPWHEIHAQFGPLDSTPPPSGHRVLADLLMPAIRASYHANARSLAMLRAVACKELARSRPSIVQG